MSIYDIVSLTAQHQLWLSLSFIDQLKHFSCTAFSAWWRTVWLSLALTCCHFSSHFQWLSAIAEHSHRMKDRSKFVQAYNMYWCKLGSVLIYVSSMCRAQGKGLAQLGWLWCIHMFMHAHRIHACPECRTYLMMHYRGLHHSQQYNVYSSPLSSRPEIKAYIHWSETESKALYSYLVVVD